MKNRHPIEHLLQRFPEYRPSMERLRHSNASFQSLWDDYESCLGALAYWQESTETRAPVLCGEYATLLHDLEEEVLDYLENEAREA